MVVNSLAFLWFFLIVLAIYYLCQKQKEIQNIFLLGSSYWFYSQVDIKMTGLLVVLTLVFWLLGKGVHLYLEKEDERKAAIVTNVGVVIGIGALFYFKYLNFFAESVSAFTNIIGIHLSWTALNLVVPIGWYLISTMGRLNRRRILSVLPISSPFSQLSYQDLLIGPSLS